ncbi:hypothetical protein TRFO_26019 [Tritrichomonas foetus]|uniref:Uncharacterized protein n=1 Tax=Tritrichomonas foetus TaxID=1144522 RepID=A0A1J4K3Y1_9EUKA|nr:hypothetical protein TRFO_26019 [Tritrichomonas foetus]|eukprot:OHT06095.1 hypothetical protein TRFO_26019 [Tritrichomonas foetus]
MYFFFILAYRTLIKLTKHDHSGSLPRYFNFEEGGTIDVNINLRDRFFEYIICSKEEFKQYFITFNQSECSFHGYIARGTLSKTIVKKGSYQFYFFQNIDHQNIEATVTLHNKKTLLDLNDFPSLYTQSIIGGLLILFFILWLINWIMNNKHTFTIHEVITISFLASILYYIISFCKYYHYHNSDEKSYLDEVQ